MASGWIIKTFDRARWDAIFGGDTPTTELMVLDAMLWEEEGYFDPASEKPRPGPARDRILASTDGRHAHTLARHLALAGFVAFRSFSTAPGTAAPRSCACRFPIFSAGSPCASQCDTCPCC